ncbi:UNVERIFIED_CONTAM: hypothetical protein HDU68_011422 [Siphonaria sp. JEL0065]|nr:hypothetical protein HDU68_011422 [Siphonaria sp. JEL0065]
MESVDRTSWRYESRDERDVEEQLDTLDLRCIVCTEGLSEPSRRLDGEAAQPKPEIAATLNCLRVVCQVEGCMFDGSKADHIDCPGLVCPVRDRGCDFVAADLTALLLHKNSCLLRDAFCPKCFPQIQPNDNIRLEPDLDHRKSCTHETRLLDWSPFLKFGMKPGKVFREVNRVSLYAHFRHLPEQDQPTIVYSGMQTASEITSFELVSIRLYPLHYQLVQTVQDSVDSFLETNAIPKTEPISVGNKRLECIVVVGSNREENVQEFNIEFMDARFPAKGGFRAHAQLDDFVTFL